MAQTVLAQIKQYSADDLDWKIIHPSTSGTIVELGKSIEVRGHNIGTYSVGDTIPATESVTNLLEQMANGDVPEVTWDGITGKPSSNVGDIDTAVSIANRFAESDGALTFDANKIAYAADIPTTYDATKIVGTLNVTNIPASVIERLSLVENDEALLALTSDTVQNGDSVKVKNTGKMYFVKDSEKLGTMEAFEEYSVGSAASVPWSGVTGTPTTLAGYGITDAVNVADTATTGANKVLKTNADGKIEVDTTGAAASVPFTGVTGLDGSVTADALKQAVANVHTHANKEILDKMSESAGAVLYNNKALAYKDDIITLAQIPVLNEAPEAPVAGQMYFQVISGA